MARPPPLPLPKLPLTARERQVADAYAQGGTYRAIAAQLVIAPSTVRAHVGSVYRKLGVGSKVALARALAEPRAGTATRPTVSVLPFSETGDEGRSPALADALAEGVTASLSRFRGLVVVARGTLSVADPQAAAQALGVRYLVGGSVRRAGGRLRVATELVDAETGRQLWVQRFERVSADLFELLDDLTRAIVAALGPEVEAHEIERAVRRPTADLGAWEMCCRGLKLFPTPDPARLADARACFEQAMVMDPSFAAPVAHLARAHFYEVIAGDAADPAAGVQQGLALARKAVELDPREDAAWLALAYCLALAGDPTGAQAAVEHGLQLNPNNGGLYNARALAQLFSPAGDLQRVIDDEQTALRLNPNDPLRWTEQVTIGWALLAGGGPDAPARALDWLHRADTAPHADWHAPLGLALAMAALGDPAQATRQVQAALSRRPGLTVQRITTALGPLLARSPSLAAGLAGLVALGLPPA